MKRKQVPVEATAEKREPEHEISPVVLPTESPPLETTPDTTSKKLRPDDDRPKPDEDSLKLRGIRRYESKHLRLYTDLPEELAKALPPLVDTLHAALVAYFGPLPPTRTGDEFQVNGYLMRDRARFDATGLVPFDLPQIQHGRHRRYEFWMNDQTSDYYRRHLLFHEYTHCFMTITPHPLGQRPWYIEGMAERFATHEFCDEAGQPVEAQTPAHLRVDVFPKSTARFPGWGRIELIREAIRSGEALNAPGVFAQVGEDFATDNRLYAWSWGMCRFLEDHPLSQKAFRTVSQVVDPQDVDRSFLRLFRDVEAELAQDWWLFAHHLVYGFDVPRAATTFRTGQPLAPGKKIAAKVRADRGWQSAGVMVEAGRSYRVRAEGRCVLATTTRPWVSEPPGVSVRYSEGRPMGRLLGTIRPEPKAAGPKLVGMLDDVSLGADGEFRADVGGVLYLRINDFWNELSDNSGEYTAHIERLE